MPYTDKHGNIYAPEIIDVHCDPSEGLYLQGGNVYTYEELQEMKKEKKYKLDMVVPAEIHKEVVESMTFDLNVAKDKPFTRFELPDGVATVEYPKAKDSVVCYKDHTQHIWTCENLEAARNLRTELIKSLELLNFYIDQIDKDGEIRYVR